MSASINLFPQRRENSHITVTIDMYDPSTEGGKEYYVVRIMFSGADIGMFINDEDHSIEHVFAQFPKAIVRNHRKDADYF